MIARQTTKAYPITSARDFKEFVTVTDRNGEPAIVVGGHAVSLWALHYLDKEPELKRFVPYTSKDMDFIGDRTTAMTLSRMVHQPAEPAPRNEATPVLYRIKRLFPEANRQNSTLEVLDHVAGVPRPELQRTSMIIDSKELGTRVRLPNPITCLKSVTSNLARLRQDKRDDLKKVRILMLCCRTFLREVIDLAECGKIDEGMAARPFDVLIDWTKSLCAQMCAKKHHVIWRDAFPLHELETSFIPLLREIYKLHFKTASPPRHDPARTR